MLLIDIGNTRVKWATLDNDVMGELYAAPHAGWDASVVRERVLGDVAAPRSAIVSNVGGARIGEVFSDAIVAKWNTAPTFVRTTASAAGVRCGYTQPEKLGVDRWMCVIAAHRHTQSHAVIASIGTAMTVDAVRKDGQHLGGVIVPGPDLMTDTLLRNTSDIAKHAEHGESRSSLFADNTLAAVQQGGVHALAALVERALNEYAKQVGEIPVLLLTGGASERIARQLRVSYELVPDLVLRGMAILYKVE